MFLLLRGRGSIAIECCSTQSAGCAARQTASNAHERRVIQYNVQRFPDFHSLSLIPMTSRQRWSSVSKKWTRSPQKRGLCVSLKTENPPREGWSERGGRNAYWAWAHNRISLLPHKDFVFPFASRALLDDAAASTLLQTKTHGSGQ
jgi:hypothetical protein